jgi:uncharacterized protein (TIGR00369 family)
MSISQYHAALGARFVDAVPHVRELGIGLVAVSRDRVQVNLPYRPEWLGDASNGLIHPGVTTTLVDSCSGMAVLARLEKYEPIATLDLRMDYLRPALADKTLHCAAECYRVTAHIVFVRATVWQDDEQFQVALSQSVFMRSSTSQKRVL